MAFEATQSGSGDRLMYLIVCFIILDAKQSIVGVPQILFSLWKMVGSSLHSLEFGFSLDFWSANWFKADGIQLAVIDIWLADRNSQILFDIAFSCLLFVIDIQI